MTIKMRRLKKRRAQQLQTDLDRVRTWRHVDQVSNFQRELQEAIEIHRALQRDSAALQPRRKIRAFDRGFSNVEALQLHIQKADAFQRERENAAVFHADVDAFTQLTDEMKRQVFLKLRDQNYLASLRLEGLTADLGPTIPTLAALRAKYA